MSAVANPADTVQPVPPLAATEAPSRSAWLLGIVRTLMNYGTHLATTLRRRGVCINPAHTARSFGTLDVALILARITRALRLARGLEARIIRQAADLDAPPHAPRRIPSRPRPSAARPAAPPAQPADPRLARLPTPERIAADLRRRPIGAVLADICHDLGILPYDPLWRDLTPAILYHGGNLAALLKHMVHQIFAARRLHPTPAFAPPSSLPAVTGLP